MFRLRDHLSWCQCGGCVVFLDLAADRYFSLPSAAGAAFVRLAERNPDRDDLNILQPLIDSGILIEDRTSEGLASPPAIEAAASDLLDRPYPSPGMPLLVRLFASELRIARLLRTRPLLTLLRSVGAGEPQSSRHTDQRAQLEAIVAASMTLSLILRATDRCLVRAIAVQAMCRRRGIGSRLVFGVRMNPFSAHSWVQHGSAVLVGDYEQVRIYKPILALG